MNTQPARKPRTRRRSAKIFSITGHLLPDPEKAHPHVVAKLKEMLAYAEGGQIRGLACVIVHPNDTLSTTFRGTYGPSMIGGLEILKIDIRDSLMDHDK